MYHHVDYRRFKTFLTKLLSVFLIYSLFFTSTANAANVGGWTMGNPIVQGASVVYDGTKRIFIDGSEYVKKGSAKITPSASAVSKVLARGVAGVALSVAVEQLLGSVDWVLDPANNSIKYTDSPQSSDDLVKPNQSYGFVHQLYPDFDSKIYSSEQSACLAMNSISSVSYWRPVAYDGRCYSTPYPSRSFPVSSVQNPAYDPAYEEPDNTKSLPLHTVAAQVISNAQSSDSEKSHSAQLAIIPAAADIVAEAETDNTKARPIVQQLESSASTKPADEAAAEKANEAVGTSKPNSANPEVTDLALEFPAFCGWAPLVCEAAQSAVDFMASEDIPESDNEPPQIDEINIGSLDTSAFQATPGCPSPITAPISFGSGGSVQISYEPICQLASKWSFVAPLIGFISGAMILIGVGRKGEDGDS